MPYAQLDDRYHDTKKVRRVLKIEPAAIAIHVMAITYCNQHNTDGEIESDRIDGWIALMPYRPAQKLRLLTTLIEQRLLEWREDGETYVVHDYLDWNRSAAKRLELAEQGRRGGLAKAKANGKPGPKPTPSPGSSQGSSPGYSEGQSQGSSTPRHATPRQGSVSQTARKRAASRKADQNELPAMPGELHHSAHLILSILTAVQSERGGDEPTLRGVGLAIARLPNRDHVRVARELEHWALAGTGQAKPVKDWARTFGTFLDRSPAGAPVRVGEVVPIREAREERRIRGSAALDGLIRASEEGGRSA